MHWAKARRAPRAPMHYHHVMIVDSIFQEPLDAAALAYFLVGWVLFAQSTQGRLNTRPTLTSLMNRQRESWIRTMARRDLRMIDTNIMMGLQQGTAFFASSALIALGGCFALLGSSDRVVAVIGDFPVTEQVAAPVFEAKVLGLAAILAYAFFKFGWAYRIFNYCSILIGAVPMRGDHIADEHEVERAVVRAARMNQLGGKHFNAGLRAIFFALGYLGWFIGPWVFIATTTCTLFVLIRRQFFSAARQALLD
ncbi:DUF599 domain-containing protein [Aliihoeflea aestuarii]|jgi:uncharacterized membrane protein|uniref:DUF599 domain-containing protein n=1 Tax=Aliihoeflea aestuarii TaxID=453840 RepID=UPI0027E2E781|nr:DUF599 family protein [Aliihoeflea aestuarii]